MRSRVGGGALVTFSYRLPAGVNTISLVIRYSPSTRPPSSVWIIKVCVYVKLSRSVLNSASRAANRWIIWSMGIEGGSFEATDGAPFGVAACAGAADAGLGSGEGASIPAGDFIGPCCCAESGRNRQDAAKHVKIVIAARHRFCVTHS